VRIVIFTHSLLSCWNHGNAHFLRGVVTELLARGHDVRVQEPKDAWSVQNLVRDHGPDALQAIHHAYPSLHSNRYDLRALDLDDVLSGADLVLVHEWNDHDLVRRIGRHHVESSEKYTLLFHDTHHRSITDHAAMSSYDLSGYDGVLAFGEAVKEVYERRGWARRAFVWHEAADVRVFRPRLDLAPDLEEGYDGDLVWIGNWGDEERTEELREFLLEPVRALRLRAKIHGVRYPEHAAKMLEEHGVSFGGWLPNFRAPEVFAGYKVTVHVPRRPYVEALPGIPTIRVFEALACGIPLVSAPWDDVESLFTPGDDFLVARDGEEMKKHLADLVRDPVMRRTLAARGRATVLSRHTCSHRVAELLGIVQSIAGPSRRPHRQDSVRIQEISRP
jgi:spore maturation protein CgeB